MSPGLINGLATGSFKGLAGDGPLYIATITFQTLAEGATTIDLGPNVSPAGPFVSAITFQLQDVDFIGAGVDVTGGAPGPRILVQPPQVNFPDTVVGASSFEDVTVHSIGTLPLTIGSVEAPQAPFALASDGCTGTVLEPAASCVLSVRFTPTAVGPAAGSLTVVSDAANAPEVDVALGGTGLAVPLPDINAPGLVVVDAIRVGQSDETPIIVSNAGADPLAIGDVGAANVVEPPFSIPVDACSQRSLSAGEFCHIVLSFAPTAAGLATGDFDIPSNDPDEPDFVVRLRGTGEPRITLVASDLEGQAGRCQNLTTGQSATVLLGGGTNLLCERAGLAAAAGDDVSVLMRGVAQSATRLTGRALGMTVDIARCVNDMTGQAVTINPPGPAIDWNCIGGGLAVTPGDTVSMTAVGDAL